MHEQPPDVTLNTLHQDLTGLRDGFTDLQGEMRAGFADLKSEMRAGFADLKVTIVTGFASMPTRESSEEIIRLLREGNRVNEQRFAQSGVRAREQHLETQQILRTLAEGQLGLTTEVKELAIQNKALVARIDASLRRRDNGGPA